MKNKKEHSKFQMYGLRGLAKEAALRMFPIWYHNRMESVMRGTNPYADEGEHHEFKGNSKYCLGIIEDFSHFHKYYIAACREMNVSYKLIDILAPDWIAGMQNCGCDAFLVWSSAISTVRKQLYDERLLIMVRDLKKIIFPTYEELWIWESKRRMSDWLVAHEVPMPKTWVFYDYDQAADFIKNTEFPIVFKPDFGDCAKGVEVLRSQKAAFKVLKRAFTRGFKLSGAHLLDRQWGSILFQQYVPHTIEWRTVRIGESFFAYQKVKVGDFASGSHAFRFETPPNALLDFVKQITDKANFMSMNLDIFEPSRGKFLVNELQALFGAMTPKEQCVINGKPGRMLYDESKKKWRFEEGTFCENQLCNLRVQYLLEAIDKRKS